jgi:hypothetical protein
LKKTLKLSALVLSLIMPFLFCSCNISLGQQEKLSLVEEIVAEIQKECELPEMTEVSEHQLAQFYAIDKADVANFSAFVSADSMTKDEIILIEAFSVFKFLIFVFSSSTISTLETNPILSCFLYI